MTPTDILRWLVETSLAVSILILLVLLIRKPFARIFGARAAYALWLAPPARLFLPEFAVLPRPEALVAADVVFPADASLAAGASAAGQYDIAAVAAAAALLVWIMVAAAWFSMKMAAQARFMRAMLAASAPASEAVAALAETVRKDFRVRRKLRVRICHENTGPLVIGPLVIGLARPIIFLPADFEQSYTQKERRLALAHEIAHIARHDMTAAFAALAFQAAQWPNPLAHIAVRVFRADQEAACDAHVLTRHGPGETAKSDYASAILKSARVGARGAAHSPAYGLSLAHPVKERLMLLKKTKQSPLRRIAGGGGAAALILTGLAATADYGYAADDEKAEETKTQTREEKRVVVIRAHGEGENIETLLIGDDDFKVVEGDEGGRRLYKFVDGESAPLTGPCVAEDGEAEPVKLEWKDEDGDGPHKTITRSVICLTGDEAADPEKRAAALKDAIDRMEADAKKEEARRKKMIAALRKQLRELEQQEKKKN